MTPEREARLRARAAAALYSAKGTRTGTTNRLPPPIARACPDCGAPKDRPCRHVRTGAPMTSHHRGRLRAPTTPKDNQ